MKVFYPMATRDGKIDALHTLTTYDNLDSIEECLKFFETWLSSGYNIDRMWIQEYELGEYEPTREIKVELRPTVVGEI